MRLDFSELEHMDASIFNTLKALKFDKSSVELNVQEALTYIQYDN